MHQHFRRLLLIILAMSILFGMIPVSTAVPEVYIAEDNTVEHEVLDDRGQTEFEETTPFPSKDIAETSRILNYVDEKEFLSNNYVYRLEDVEQLNTYVYQKEDGSRAVYYLAENVKYIDENGKIIEKDITLKEIESGYTTVANDVKVVIPDSIVHGVEFSFGDDLIKIYPYNDTESKGEKEGNSIIYSEVFGQGTELRYTPTLSGLKEDIIVENGETGVFSFRIETNGLGLFEDEEGLYIAVEEDSEIRYHLCKIFIYDYVGHRDYGNIVFDTIEENQEYLITIDAEEFLNNAEVIFPVTIDPSIEIRDEENGEDAIMDAEIHPTHPNYCFNGLISNLVGTSGYYGSARAVIKFPGLLATMDYQIASADQITNVTFYVKEDSLTAQNKIYVKPILNVNWTENTAKWSLIGDNISSTTITYNYLTNGQWTGFNITNLVKGWKNGIYSAASGFAMINEDETSYKSFASCENEDSSIRPYVVMTHTVPVNIQEPIMLDVDENGTLQLTTHTEPSGLTVTWSSSNNNLATVSSNGVVTGIKAYNMPVQITASVTISGVTYTSHRMIYVTIPDGVYYIQNESSEYYLTVDDAGIYEGNTTEQQDKYGSAALLKDRLSQMWKIKHLGSGLYTIRPYLKLNMGLYVDVYDDVRIHDIGETDDFSVDDDALWSIDRVTVDSYTIRSEETDYRYAMCAEGEEEYEQIVVDEYVNFTYNTWVFERITSPFIGMVVFDRNDSTSNVTKNVAPGEARTMNDQSLVVSVCDTDNLSQHWGLWSSSDTSKATINNQGIVTGVSSGTVTITATRMINGVLYSASYTLIVNEISNGTYYIKNKQSEKYADITNQTMANGTTCCQNNYLGIESQRWTFTHVGNGYYTIKSANSTDDYYLGVQNNSSSNNAQIVLRTGSIQNGMKWKLIPTSNGRFKIMARSGESNSRVLSAGSTSNGALLYQKTYTNDSDYMDEWYVEHNRVDLEILYSNSYSNRFSNSLSRINNIIAILSDLFFEDYLVEVNCVSLSSFLSYADANCSTSYYNCTHTTNSNCKNSRLFVNGDITLEEYHHTNIYNIMFRVSFPVDANLTKIVFIGHDNCCIIDSTHRTNVDYGIAYINRRFAAIMNYASVEREIQTTIHEFGHLYDAVDHYGGRNGVSTSDLGEEYSQYCIYGELRNTEYVTQNLIICDGCKAMIASHSNKYNDYD